MRASNNQLSNIGNRFQGSYPKVLFVCSAGLLRSATASHIFSGSPYNWNTRSVASNSEYGLNPVNEACLAWADVIIAMENYHIELMKIMDINFEEYQNKVVVLNVPDHFGYRDHELIEILKEKIKKCDNEKVKEILPISK